MPNDKTSSLKWAIDELSKQRLDFENQLSIAQKRDETHELITEVHAQKEALQKRISALEDGLKVSSNLSRFLSLIWNLIFLRLMTNWKLQRKD